MRVCRRGFLFASRGASSSSSSSSAAVVRVTVRNVDRQGGTQVVEGRVGDTLLQACWAAHVTTLEGACDHAMACSTCQVYVDEQWTQRTGNASEEELDMLDLAFEPKPNSRLACQITLKPSLDGLVVNVPDGVMNRLNDLM